MIVSGACLNIIPSNDGLETEDGLPLLASLAIHSRIRCIFNPLTLLQKAETLRRVVNAEAGTCEDAVDVDNILGIGFPLLKWRNQVA